MEYQTYAEAERELFDLSIEDGGAAYGLTPEGYQEYGHVTIQKVDSVFMLSFMPEDPGSLPFSTHIDDIFPPGKE